MMEARGEVGGGVFLTAVTGDLAARRVARSGLVFISESDSN